ncbi:hypothetical protein [Streptomyces cyaneofuscatus]|uniref:hypothetical protein n=1 Tax=Streptomyces cyaneofuscatus TaxID=66883 RepID=UPI0033B7E920
MNKMRVATGVAVLSIAAGAFFVIPSLTGEATDTVKAQEVSSKNFVGGHDISDALAELDGLKPADGVHLYRDYEVTTGGSVLVSGSQPNLTSSGFNDTASVVLNNTDQPYCLSVDADFRGATIDLPPRQSVKLDGHYAKFNDQLSSLKPC